MPRAIKTLAWLVTAGFTVVAVAFVMMAIDGYDYSSPEFPLPNSLAELGYDLSWIGQLAAVILMAATWVVFSIWTGNLRERIPTTWKHSKASVWLWWLVPVAGFWMPREVYLEVGRAALPGDPVRSKGLIDRWWLSMVLFLAANQIEFVGTGTTFLASAAIAAAVFSGLAAFHLGRMVSGLARPEITFETSLDYGDLPMPVGTEAPSVPGWYNDPSGQARHQAYWDGGRYTGAVRPDPRLFPSQPQHGVAQKDRLKIWLILFGIVFTIASITYSIYASFTLIEESGGFDIAAFLGVL